MTRCIVTTIAYGRPGNTVNTILTKLVTFAATLAERVYVITALETTPLVAYARQPILGATELQIMQLIWNEGYGVWPNLRGFVIGRHPAAGRAG